MHPHPFLAFTFALLLAICAQAVSAETAPVAVDVGIASPVTLFDSVPGSTCGKHLRAGLPAASDQLLCRQGYAVGYNYKTREADWVAYHVTAASVAGRVERNNHFREDVEIPAGLRATLSDYAGSGYDRGHLAPAATMDFNLTSMDESFLLSNIAPQLPGFNRAGWADLEQYIRDCAGKTGELYVVTGPIFTATTRRSLGAGVAIPDAYYKVILKPTAPVSAFAVRIPHRAFSVGEIPSYVVSVDQVEAETGMDFFSAVTDTIEASVERITTPICALPWTRTKTAGNSENSGYSCAVNKHCSEMTSCDEAYFYLRSCGQTALDRDKDGVPCESICR